MNITFRPKTIRVGLVALLCVATGLSTLHAAPDKDAAPSATPSVSLDATDVTTARTHLGEMVEVHGTPAATGQSKSGGVFYLNFGAVHQGLAIVFFGKSSAATGVKGEDDLKQYLGKTVSVTGKLADFKNDLQIVVDSAAQIKVAPTP